MPQTADEPDGFCHFERIDDIRQPLMGNGHHDARHRNVEFRGASALNPGDLEEAQLAEHSDLGIDVFQIAERALSAGELVPRGVPPASGQIAGQVALLASAMPW